MVRQTHEEPTLPREPGGFSTPTPARQGDHSLKESGVEIKDQALTSQLQSPSELRAGRTAWHARSGRSEEPVPPGNNLETFLELSSCSSSIWKLNPFQESENTILPREDLLNTFMFTLSACRLFLLLFLFADAVPRNIIMPSHFPFLKHMKQLFPQEKRQDENSPSPSEEEAMCSHREASRMARKLRRFNVLFVL